MRRTCSSTLLCVAAATALHAQSVRPSDLDRRGAAVDRLHVWVDAVRQHPLTPDSAAERIARWAPPQLDDLAIDLLSLLELMEAPRTSSFAVWADSARGQVRRQVVYTRSELDRLRRLALSLGGLDPQALSGPDDDLRIAAARNKTVKRGAAMHTAIALDGPSNVQTSPVGPLPARPDAVIRFSDGRQVGVDGAANHWAFARMLLARVTPNASADRAVRLWYHASSAALIRDVQLHAEHFDEALRLFPDDPALLMLAGSLHEALASPRVQAFVRSAALPRGVKIAVGSTRAELERAESLFRRCLSVDPRDAEARLRLGRVLSLQERHLDGLGELELLDASAPSMQLYYASLFAGSAAEGLGRRDDAQAAYERAAALYPLAQAPRFALSQLAANTGNLMAAADALGAALAEPPNPMPDNDPFWTYHVAAGRNADALLEDAYRALLTETMP